MFQPLPWSNPTFTAHVVAFALAAVVCFVMAPRTRRVEDPHVRRGLMALVLTSGVWATAHLGFVVAADSLKLPFYTLGLVAGFAAVWMWLYFCSAYAGRSLHLSSSLRWASLAVLASVIAVKLTNPWHHYYFTSAVAQEPFLHLAVDHGTLHWLVMGLSYALATLGYFMLYELFSEVGQDTRPLTVLMGLFVLPLGLDLVGVTTPYLLEITYEPLGVAAFSVGVTAVYHTRFRTVQLAGERREPTVVLSEEGRVRDYNRRAAELFPALEEPGALGSPLADVVPDLAAHVESDDDVFAADCGDETRTFTVAANPFASGTTPLGRLLVLDDVTEREQYRQELERQNERLERFASVVSHDLRNPLTVAKGRIDILRADEENEHLEATAAALDRMDTLIEDVLALARQGRAIDETEAVDLAALAEEAWSLVDTGDATLETTPVTVDADPDRLQQLLENLFRNSVEHGGPEVTVTVGPLDDGGFYVADDGPGVPPEERERVFEFGHSSESTGTGFGLAIVAEIAEAHGWDVALAESESGGARFEFRTDGT